MSVLYCDGGALTTLDISDSPALSALFAGNNSLTQTAVDDILITLDSNGVLNGGVYLSGGLNEAPSESGFIAAHNLRTKGWSVTTAIPTDVFWYERTSDAPYSDVPSGTVVSDGNSNLFITARSLLTSFDATNSYTGGVIDASNCANLTSLNISYCAVTSLNISGCTSLQSLEFSGNYIDNLDISGLTSLNFLYSSLGSYVPLTLDSVNNILITLDQNGLESGTVILYGETPTGDGLTAQASLESKGWQVVIFNF
jgi:hypothetical protein